MQRIVKAGRWRYDGDFFEKIIIAEQDWDGFFEEGYDKEFPFLNAYGLIYHLHYGDYSKNEYGNISSKGMSVPFLSQIEAEEYARKIFKDLEWE